MKEKLARKLRQLAKRLDSGPFPGELIDVSYTPGANMVVIVDGIVQEPPPGIWEATVKLHTAHTGLTLRGRLEPVS